jgi:MOSC domain-containing protein YiiM
MAREERLQRAEVLLEVTQIGKVCHERCAIYYQAGDCVMPREGIFVKIHEGGQVKVGDPIEVLSLPDIPLEAGETAQNPCPAS